MFSLPQYSSLAMRLLTLRRPLVQTDFIVFASNFKLAIQPQGMTAGCELFAALKAFKDHILPRLLNFEWKVCPFDLFFVSTKNRYQANLFPTGC
jgi:hypothetical protein